MAETINAATGHEVRLGRVLDLADGRTVILPFDHGAVMGPRPGMIEARDTAALAVAGPADAVLVNPGQARRIAPRLGRQVGLVVKITNGGSIDTDQVPFASVESTVRLGADAIAFEYYLGSPDERASYALFGQVREACDRFGIPIVAHAYVYPKYESDSGPRSWVHTCRLAVELGADIVKTAWPGDAEIFAEMVAGTGAPIVVAGGEGSDPRALLGAVDAALGAGAVGVAIGRQVWGAPDPLAMLRAVRAVVHDRTDVDAVLEKHGLATAGAVKVGAAHGSAG